MKRLIVAIVITLGVAACATDGKILDSSPTGGEVRSGSDSGSGTIATPDSGKGQTLRYLGK